MATAPMHYAWHQKLLCQVTKAPSESFVAMLYKWFAVMQFTCHAVFPQAHEVIQKVIPSVVVNNMTEALCVLMVFYFIQTGTLIRRLVSGWLFGNNQKEEMRGRAIEAIEIIADCIKNGESPPTKLVDDYLVSKDPEIAPVKRLLRPRRTVAKVLI